MPTLDELRDQALSIEEKQIKDEIAEQEQVVQREYDQYAGEEEPGECSKCGAKCQDCEFDSIPPDVWAESDGTERAMEAQRRIGELMEELRGLRLRRKMFG